MSYYWFNSEELLKKTRDRYHNKGGKKAGIEITKKF